MIMKKCWGVFLSLGIIVVVLYPSFRTWKEVETNY